MKHPLSNSSSNTFRRFRLYTKPQPKERPRTGVNKATGRTIVYSGKKSGPFEKNVKALFKLVLPAIPFPKGVPVALHLVFAYNRPKRLLEDRPDAYLWYVNTPDVDNLQKSIFDALNEVVWEDDRQVAQVNVMKVYAPVGVDNHIDIHWYPLGGVPIVMGGQTCLYMNSSAQSADASKKKASRSPIARKPSPTRKTTRKKAAPKRSKKQ